MLSNRDVSRRAILVELITTEPQSEPRRMDGVGSSFVIVSDN